MDTKTIRGWIAGIMLLLAIPPVQGDTGLDPETQPVRVMLITGATPVDRYLHYNRTLVPSSFYSVLDDCKDIVWDHSTLDEAAFQNDIRDEYDVAIFFNHSDALSDAATGHLKSFIEDGKGLIVLHSGLSSYNNWEWWWKEIMGGKYQMADAPGFPRSQSSTNKEEDINFQPASDHPITKAVGAFAMKDEVYKGMGVQPGVTVLYQTSNPRSDGPLVWIGPTLRTRVVVIQPGHGANAYRHPGFRRLVQEAVRWAGKKSS